jgi:hypothetical protein
LIGGRDQPTYSGPLSLDLPGGAVGPCVRNACCFASLLELVHCAVVRLDRHLSLDAESLEALVGGRQIGLDGADVPSLVYDPLLRRTDIAL